MKKKPSFIPYNPDQITFLPPSLEDLIPPNHVVRIVNKAIDNIDLSSLTAKYKGGGRSSYNPIMMLKIIIYAYVEKIYSCRKIEKACRENIMFMWLSGGAKPDFITINRFRSERMKGVLLDIFTEIVALLAEERYIDLNNYFLDGTKIEANANKYSFVWGKSTKRYKENLRKKCIELFAEIEKANQDENAEYGEMNLEELGIGEEINAETIKAVSARINEKLKQQPKNRTLKKSKRLLEREYLPRMEKYEKQEEILAERRSYSKTDHDATFMRMKDDHMGNGQLKPGYNVQIGTENQFILNYSVHQNAGDTSCMQEHLERAKTVLGKLPNNICADAGYGSEENYEYLKLENVNNYVKYSTFHKEDTKKWKYDITKVQNFKYNEEADEYVCGYGRTLKFVHEKIKKSKNDYESTIRVYRSICCKGCPHKAQCIKSENPDANREISINRRLNELKLEAKKNLTSEKGIELRSKRPIEPESVFGNIKANFQMRRFLLRGLEKVDLEWGLFCIAHNMRKMATATVPNV